MSQKLEKCVAKKACVVMGNMTGEVMLHIKGVGHTIGKGQKLDVMALLDHPRDLLKVGGLRDLVKTKRLVIV